MEKATAILKLMVEGMSVRSIERITGVHRDTILRLLLLAAEKITTNLRHKFEQNSV
jgi:transposase-like protein